MASRSLNKVMLIGNLTRDPELRYTPSGVAVCTFGMATNRSWKDADGNAQEAADFHRIVSWGKLAELCSQWLFKGRKAFVEGRLQTRDWTGQDSVKRTTTEIVIDSMLILDSRRQGEESPTAGGEEPQPKADQPRPEGDQPMVGAGAKKAEKVDKKDKAEDVNAEDIPF